MTLLTGGEKEKHRKGRSKKRRVPLAIGSTIIKPDGTPMSPEEVAAGEQEIVEEDGDAQYDMYGPEAGEDLAEDGEPEDGTASETGRRKKRGRHGGRRNHGGLKPEVENGLEQGLDEHGRPISRRHEGLRILLAGSSRGAGHVERPRIRRVSPSGRVYVEEAAPQDEHQYGSLGRQSGMQQQHPGQSGMDFRSTTGVAHVPSFNLYAQLNQTPLLSMTEPFPPRAEMHYTDGQGRTAVHGSADPRGSSGHLVRFPPEQPIPADATVVYDAYGNTFQSVQPFTRVGGPHPPYSEDVYGEQPQQPGHPSHPYYPLGYYPPATTPSDYYPGRPHDPSARYLQDPSLSFPFDPSLAEVYDHHRPMHGLNMHDSTGLYAASHAKGTVRSFFREDHPPGDSPGAEPLISEYAAIRQAFSELDERRDGALNLGHNCVGPAHIGTYHPGAYQHPAPVYPPGWRPDYHQAVLGVPGGPMNGTVVSPTRASLYPQSYSRDAVSPNMQYGISSAHHSFMPDTVPGGTQPFLHSPGSLHTDSQQPHGIGGPMTPQELKNAAPQPAGTSSVLNSAMAIPSISAVANSPAATVVPAFAAPPLTDGSAAAAAAQDINTETYYLQQLAKLRQARKHVSEVCQRLAMLENEAAVKTAAVAKVPHLAVEPAAKDPLQSNEEEEAAAVPDAVNSEDEMTKESLEALRREARIIKGDIKVLQRGHKAMVRRNTRTSPEQTEDIQAALAARTAAKLVKAKRVEKTREKRISESKTARRRKMAGFDEAITKFVENGSGWQKALEDSEEEDSDQVHDPRDKEEVFLRAKYKHQEFHRPKTAASGMPRDSMTVIFEKKETSAVDMTATGFSLLNTLDRMLLPAVIRPGEDDEPLLQSDTMHSKVPLKRKEISIAELADGSITRKLKYLKEQRLGQAVPRHGEKRLSNPMIRTHRGEEPFEGPVELAPYYFPEMGVIGRPVPQRVAKEARPQWDQDQSVAPRVPAERAASRATAAPVGGVATQQLEARTTSPVRTRQTKETVSPATTPVQTVTMSLDFPAAP
ncbi:hypothetical protein BV898_06723 [Hypsibius exemplaris]|uniref:Uncharacterized protein n=1 Tax=Hypsibius exemplaris TaxID=2072580 RepID=A0A1W0WVU2_HYPEX|nr:hypothetical protein BV898_06723 [Hypsibius exemplaris]